MEVGVDQDQLEAQFERQPDPGDEDVLDEKVEDVEAAAQGEADAPDAAVEDPPPPSTEEPKYVEVLGQRLTEEEAQNLVDFYSWARANPQHVQAIDSYLTGNAQIVPREYLEQQQRQQQQAQPEQSQADLEEWEALPAAVKQKLSELDELKGVVGSLTQEQRQAQMATAQSAVQKGAENFKSRYSLSDEDMEVLMAETARLQVLPTIVQQTGDMLKGVEEALEMTYWRSTDFREREFAKQQTQARQQQQRQRKASALSGSSGSVPRASEPRTQEQRREAMVSEIATALRDGSIDTTNGG